MKHIKLFESFEDVESICSKYGISNYTINTDGSIDVDGDVNIDDKKLIKLPLKFGNVTGNLSHFAWSHLPNSIREIFGSAQLLTSFL